MALMMERWASVDALKRPVLAAHLAAKRRE
jgi:hypothetical protein